jgi:hypothetical protein
MYLPYLPKSNYIFYFTSNEMFTLPDSSCCLWGILLLNSYYFRVLRKLLILSENIVESVFSNMNETPGTIFEVNCQAHWLSEFLFSGISETLLTLQ